MLVEGGGNSISLKGHGGWLLSTVTEGYIEESINRKIEMFRKLFDRTIEERSTSSPKDIVHENKDHLHQQEFHNMKY